MSQQGTTQHETTQQHWTVSICQLNLGRIPDCVKSVCFLASWLNEVIGGSAMQSLLHLLVLRLRLRLRHFNEK